MNLIVKIKNSNYYKRILKEINWQNIFNIFVTLAIICLVYIGHYEHKQIQKCKFIILKQTQMINLLKHNTQNLQGDVEVLDSIIRVSKEKFKN